MTIKVTVMEAATKVPDPWQPNRKVGIKMPENVTVKAPISGKSSFILVFLRQNSTHRDPKRLRDSELDVLGGKSPKDGSIPTPHRPTPAPDFPPFLMRNM
jgi:hypothetical protein